MKQKIKHEILSGIHPVLEALKAGRRNIDKIYISKDRSLSRVNKIVKRAREANVDVDFIPLDELDKITDAVKHQGVAAKVGFLPIKRAESVLKDMMSIAEGTKETSNNNFIIILEGIEDPNNFGALIRTALCAGVNHIVIPKDRSISPSPSVSRASAGAMEHADICVVTNTKNLIKKLKDLGFWIAGLDANGDTPLFKADLTGNIALVIGGEHRGIRPLVKKECDFLLSLPLSKGITSLNASVAGGIVMYEVLRQRSL